MSGAALQRAAVADAEAIIESAVVGAAHDGEAELIVTLRHANGALETVALEPDIAFHLMNICGVGEAAALAGQPWRRILEGL